MQEELLQFKLQQVWVLVDLPHGMKVIGTKWVYRNKRDERGVVVRNKARLVAQGYTQEEGIDYDEVFAPVARKKLSERLQGYQSQLYGLHQAPRAWYATLSTFLEKHGYKRGTIDKTLFIKRDKKDIMLVQVYVDDIIFGSTKKSWCDEFEALMKSRFQMSSMGELTFFLGLQVKQNKAGIFISQDKYVAEILKKFDLVNVKTCNKPPWRPKCNGQKIGSCLMWMCNLYRSMIGFYIRGAPRPLLPAMLLVATTNTNAGQEHPDVAQSQPSSSTIPVPSTSLPPEQSPPPIPTPIPTSAPTPILESNPHLWSTTYEGTISSHQHTHPHKRHAQDKMTLEFASSKFLQIMTRIDSLEKDLKQTKLTMGSAIVKLVNKVKKMEGILKSRNVVLSDSKEEESEAQGRKSQDDPLVSLVQGLIREVGIKIERDKGARRFHELGFSEEVSTARRSLILAERRGHGSYLTENFKFLKKVKEEFDKLEKQVESFAPINFKATKDSLKRFGEELQTKTSKRLKSDEAKDDESTKKTRERRKHIARKGLHSKKTDEDESEASKDADPSSGTNIPVNPVPVAMKPPSIATYKIIKQGEKGLS
ncbi:putative ribonuclease H-like domain-containing protein [Tanacetum coccineum]